MLARRAMLAAVAAFARPRARASPPPSRIALCLAGQVGTRAERLRIARAHRAPTTTVSSAIRRSDVEKSRPRAGREARKRGFEDSIFIPPTGPDLLLAFGVAEHI